ncbi:lytic polysaccharide monooxygenase [Sphaerobolus stellatus SS14]|uniref:Lytic polysaccharide monooxygenase n=1 Tax=Sphaerobolus stellatus (strain SS14) TaxID=990650 RepID=A0A0C9V866_SPHS4|nr:lytic polysaccharide monooxygenase [Sphaerobolus stellatus SS14]
MAPEMSTKFPAITNGGTSLAFPNQGIDRITFTIPPNLPGRQYLVCLENTVLHLAGTWRYQGGLAFFIVPFVYWRRVSVDTVFSLCSFVWRWNIVDVTTIATRH